MCNQPSDLVNQNSEKQRKRSKVSQEKLQEIWFKGLIIYNKGLTVENGILCRVNSYLLSLPCEKYCGGILARQ